MVISADTDIDIKSNIAYQKLEWVLKCLLWCSSQNYSIHRTEKKKDQKKNNI